MLNIRLLKEAQKYIKDPNQIINGFDLRFEWASPELLDQISYTLDELTSLENDNLLVFNDSPDSKKEFLQQLTSEIGVTTLTCRTRDNHKICIEAAYKTFKYDNEIYMVLKTLKTSTI